MRAKGFARLATWLATGVLLVGCAAPSALAPVDQLQVERRALLPLEVAETSGLARARGELWTLNDSGDQAQIYRLHPQTGAVLATRRIQDAVNIDWEEMAADSQQLHLLDCGNNLGRREWMQIYSLDWSSLRTATEPGEIPSRLLEFRFADAGPTAGAYRHNNDCEAAAVVGEQIWIFSKNWQDQHTRLYKVDLNGASRQSLTAVGRYPANGLITGADYDAGRQQLVLIGYTRGRISSRAFIWTVPVLHNMPDWDRARYYRLSPAGQWEAVVWTEEGLLLSRESSLLGQAWLGVVRLP